MIKAVTFDLDDTLWSTADVIGRAEMAMFAFLGEAAPAFVERESPVSFLEYRRGVMQRRSDMAYDLLGIRRLAIQEVLEQLGEPHAEAVATEASRVFQNHRQKVRYYPGVLNMLARLSAHVPLAAITNGTTHIDQTDGAEFFKFGLRAEQVPPGKPDEIIFRVAFDRLGVAPKDVVHVGDNWDLDVLAAKSLGCQTVWVGENAPGPEADFVMAEVSNLDRVLGF